MSDPGSYQKHGDSTQCGYTHQNKDNSSQMMANAVANARGSFNQNNDIVTASTLNDANGRAFMS